MSRRLAILSHYFDEHRGGIEIVVARLAGELAKLDWEIVWLAAGEAGGQENGVRREPLSATNFIERVLKIPYPLLFPSALRRIFGVVRSCDAVMAHDAIYVSSIAGFVAARLYGKPFVVVQHIGLVPYRNPLMRGMMQAANRLLVEPILHRADQVAFISSVTQAYFAHLAWKKPSLLIFNGVDAEIFQAPRDADDIAHARRSLDLPAGRKVALFVGRFVEKKGLPILAALARMRPDILFAFAGWGTLDPNSWGLPNVRVFASLSGASLAQLYRAADILLLPSVGEGFPLVAQEALACGLPVLCGLDTATADAAGAPFLTGVAVDSDIGRTAQLYAEALARRLAEPDDFACRHERARFVQGQYSWCVAAEQHARVLGNLIAASPKSRSPASTRRWC